MSFLRKQISFTGQNIDNHIDACEMVDGNGVLIVTKWNYTTGQPISREEIVYCDFERAVEAGNILVDVLTDKSGWKLS
jgi:hypothetical protein